MSPVLGKGLIIGAVAAAGGTGIWYWGGDLFGSGAEFVSHESDIQGKGQGQNQNTNSLGAKYGKYLLSSGHNPKIWNRIYDKYKENSLKQGDTNQTKDKFKDVTEAYSTENNNTTALNKVCEEAYKVTDSNNLVEDSSTEANKYIKSNIWKFCTLGVTTLKDSTETFSIKGSDGNVDSSKSAIGSDTNNQKLFVSAKVETTGNDWFWKIRSEEFWQNSGTRSGSKSASQGDTNKSVFKTLFDDSEKKKANENIRGKCQEAYSLEAEDTKKNKSDAELFCSIKLDLAAS